MRLLTLAEYADLPRPGLAWLVHKLIPRPGLILLLGPAKVGKSHLALDVALRVAQGREFLGAKVTQGTVLLVQLDTSEAVWRDRLCELRADGVDISGPLLMAHPDDQPVSVDILTHTGKSWLHAAIAKADPALVVIDVLREVHTADENSSQNMKLVGDAIADAVRGRSALILHHTSKIPADVPDPDPVRYSRGSSYITGKVDGFWLLYGTWLRIKCRFDEDTRYRAVRHENGMWTFPDVEHAQSTTAAVLALCAEFPELSHAELATVARERWGLSRATYYRRLAGRGCAHVRQPPENPSDGG